MQMIPIRAVPNQTLQVLVASQAVTLNVYQFAYGLFIDVYLNDALVVGGVICNNLTRIVRSAYLGLAGDFAFVDTQGSKNPVYTGLGDRFQLLYLEEADLPA